MKLCSFTTSLTSICPCHGRPHPDHTENLRLHHGPDDTPSRRQTGEIARLRGCRSESDLETDAFFEESDQGRPELVAGLGRFPSGIAGERVDMPGTRARCHPDLPGRAVAAEYDL